MSQKRFSWIVFGVAIGLLIAGVVLAAVTTIPLSALIPSTDYYTDRIGGGIGPIAGIGGPDGRNDDAFIGPLALGFTLNFFGTNYTQFFLNNNGNISFNAGISAFTPVGPQGAPQPIISPFFADVDTRNPLSGVVHLRTDIPNEIIATWDQVGYFGSHADKLDSFQLVLRGPAFVIPAGEGAIGFFWKTMQWETGDASGGTGGFGGTPAAVGFGDGASNGSILEGSITNGIAARVQNHSIWFNLTGGVPTPIPTGVPAPGTLWLITLGLIGLGMSQWLWSRGRKSAA